MLDVDGWNEPRLAPLCQDEGSRRVWRGVLQSCFWVMLGTLFLLCADSQKGNLWVFLTEVRGSLSHSSAA